MAFYLDIRKSGETSSVVEYTYSTTDGRRGRFHIDRKSGQTLLLECAPEEVGERLYRRAAFKIEKAWREGALPDATCWAS